MNHIVTAQSITAGKRLARAKSPRAHESDSPRMSFQAGQGMIQRVTAVVRAISIGGSPAGEALSATRAQNVAAQSVTKPTWAARVTPSATHSVLAP